MGSWPSVVNPEEVAELSRISVLGCGGPSGWGELACGHMAADRTSNARIVNGEGIPGTYHLLSDGQAIQNELDARGSNADGSSGGHEKGEERSSNQAQPNR